MTALALVYDHPWWTVVFLLVIAGALRQLGPLVRVSRLEIACSHCGRQRVQDAHIVEDL